MMKMELIGDPVWKSTIRATQIALTVIDKCDRCGSRARHLTEHAQGNLMWCRHHFREFEEALRATAHLIRDEHGIAC